MKPKLTPKKPVEIFPPQEEQSPSYYAVHNPRKIRHQSEFTIYPISGLSKLITELSLTPNHGISSDNEIDNDDDEDQSSKIRLRYLVDVNFNLWFAPEGSASRMIPAHYQMTGEMANAARCVVAGNIEFSEDYQTITMINHKSGDFRPDFHALKLVLAILVTNEEELPSKLAAELCVENLEYSGRIKERYNLKLAELKTWVDETFSAEQQALFQTQPVATKQVTYEPPNAHASFGGKRRFSAGSSFFSAPIDDEQEPPAKIRCEMRPMRLLFKDDTPQQRAILLPQPDDDAKASQTPSLNTN